MIPIPRFSLCLKPPPINILRKWWKILNIDSYSKIRSSNKSSAPFFLNDRKYLNSTPIATPSNNSPLTQQTSTLHLKPTSNRYCPALKNRPFTTIKQKCQISSIATNMTSNQQCLCDTVKSDLRNPAQLINTATL